MLLVTLINPLLQVWLVMLLFLIFLVNIYFKSYMKPPLFALHFHISAYIFTALLDIFQLYIYI